MDNRRFMPTDIGKIVNRFLTHHFHRYVEYGFTAAMEDELDAVSRGEEEWTTPLEKFWKPFIHQVDKIERTVTREQVAQARELGKDPATGKPVTVRMGRFGPFVQIGTKDDEEKPRFAGLRPGQKMDAITLADAMELFKLPRTLGETAEGETIIANVGRFGPYLKYGSKYASLKEDDPYTVTLERAREVIRLKKEADAARLIQDFPTKASRCSTAATARTSPKEEERQDPQGARSEVAHARGVPRMLAAAPERGGRFGRLGRGRRPQRRPPPRGAGTAERPRRRAARGGEDGAARSDRQRPQRPQPGVHGGRARIKRHGTARAPSGKRRRLVRNPRRPLTASAAARRACERRLPRARVARRAAAHGPRQARPSSERLSGERRAQDRACRGPRARGVK